jgi:hypothetical protein
MQLSNTRVKFALKFAGAVLLACGIALAAGPAAGSGNTGGGTAAAGGAAGGGGGVTTAACSPLQSALAKPGFRPGASGVIGAIWTTYSLKQCTVGVTYVANITVTNLDLNLVEFTWGGSLMKSTVDDDWTGLSTNYRVDLVITDWSTGEIFDSRTFVVVTPSSTTVPVVG